VNGGKDPRNVDQVTLLHTHLNNRESGTLQSNRTFQKFYQNRFLLFPDISSISLVKILPGKRSISSAYIHSTHCRQ